MRREIPEMLQYTEISTEESIIYKNGALLLIL